MNLAGFDRMDHRRRTIWIVIFCVVVSAALAIVLSFGMRRVFSRSMKVCHLATVGLTESVTDQMLDQDTYTQTFISPFDRLKSVEVIFGTYAQTPGEGQLLVTLLHGEEKVRTWKIPLSLIPDMSYLKLDLDQVCSCSPGDEFALRFRTKGAVSGASIAICKSVREYGSDAVAPFDISKTGEPEKNGEPLEGDLCFRLRGSCPANMKALLPVMLFLCLILSLILARGLFYRYWNETLKLDELIIFLLVAACCLLFTQFFDQLNTSVGGFYFLNALREGKLLQFYSYQLGVRYFGMIGNYNIVVYLAMAVLHLPYYLLTQLKVITLDAHSIVLYYNVILGIILYLCGRIFRNVLQGYGAKERQASFGRILFYLSPIVLFGTVGFVQQDLLYVLFLLLGLRLHQKGRKDMAFLVMSVSVALKSIPLFILVPFILLSEKNIWRDIRYVMEILLVTLITGIIYGSDAGYQSVDHAMYYKNLFTSVMTLSHWEASLFLVLWFVFVCWCFYQKPMEDWKNLFIASLGGFSLFVLFCGWNPQYLVGYGIVIAVFGLMTSDMNRYLTVMTVLSGSLIAMSCLYFTDNVDNYMCFFGLPVLLAGFDSRVPAVALSILVKENVSLPLEYLQMAALSLMMAAVIFLLFRGWQEIKGRSGLVEMKKNEIYSILMYLPAVPIILYMMVSYGLIFAQ